MIEFLSSLFTNPALFNPPPHSFSMVSIGRFRTQLSFFRRTLKLRLKFWLPDDKRSHGSHLFLLMEARYEPHTVLSVSHPLAINVTTAFTPTLFFSPALCYDEKVESGLLSKFPPNQHYEHPLPTSRLPSWKRGVPSARSRRSQKSPNTPPFFFPQLSYAFYCSSPFPQYC